MRTAGTAFVLAGLLLATPLPAQAQGRARAQGIPPGQMPPAGMCRVWYDNVPPGRQPRAMNCRDAERIAARDRNARVIYGSARNRNDRWDSRNGRWDPRDDRDRRVYQDRNGWYRGVPFDNGYEDGLDKGREDARDTDSYDPTRHRLYRSGDRGYDDRYGSRDQYRNAYRDGFRAGYNDAYRSNTVSRREARTRRWPGN